MVNRGLSTSAAMTMEIMIEKFKSVIGGPTYHDVRRNNNLIGTRVKNTNTNVIPQRYFYPASESSSNENFPGIVDQFVKVPICLLYTSPSPRDATLSRMPSSA